MKSDLFYKITVLLLFFSFLISIRADENIIATIQSPNEKIRIELLSEENALYYRAFYNDKEIINPSLLGLTLSSSDLSRRLEFKAVEYTSLNENYKLPSGKKSIYQNCYNECIASFNRLDVEVNIIFRAYDDGFAFRYTIPEISYANSTFKSENSQIVINDFSYSWGQAYKSDYSWYYDIRNWKETAEQREFCAPVLIQSEDVFLLITEAANTGDCATSKIIAQGETACFTFEQVGTSSIEFPFSTPWRTVILGDLPTIVESVMVENLNPSTQIEDWSWIIPGRSSWDWGGEDAHNSVGLHMAKKYIDYANRMGWEYFTLDDGWEGGDYTLREVAEYAQSKNVKVILWSHHNRFSFEEEQMFAVLKEWKDIGIAGVKVDFWEDDSQNMMKKYDTFLKVTADLELLVNLHGCTKPSGTRRTWPHLITSEAVLGGEMYLFNSTMTPADHNINLTMTRNVIGPMDYTPGDFGTKTGLIRQHTTWAHQMALLTAFESGIQCYIDCPENYTFHIAESFFSRLPADWDDVKCLEAKPDSFVTLARRKDKDWYIASLCNKSRVLDLEFSFLEAGRSYNAYIYKDGDCKSEIVFDYKTNVGTDSKITLQLPDAGGVTIHLSENADYPKPDVKKYEAESPDNRSFGVWKEDEDGLCSGGYSMTNIGRGIYLRYQNIEVEEAGEYALTIYYMSGEERSSYIKVNEQEELYFMFNSSGGWSGRHLAYTTVIVELQAGINTIEFGNKDSFAPDFDRITIKPVVDSSEYRESIETYKRENDFLITTDINKLSVTSSYKGVVTLYSLDGKKVLQQKITEGENHIPFHDAGIYIVNVNAGTKSYSQKVIFP